MSTRLDQMEALFKALGDATRLRILGLLVNGEICVCHIYESLKIPQSKASRHLAYLRRSGLVETRRAGLWVHYRLAQTADPVVGAVADAVRRALTTVDTVQKDTNRLRGRGVPCCASAGEVPATATRTPEAAPVTVTRSRP
jgi:ArsR family transcriptional regulator